MPFSLTERDAEFYDKYLRDFLPPRMIDIHSHVWLKDFRVDGDSGPQRAVTWTSLVAEDNSFEDLAETYRLMFPEQETHAVVFGFPSAEYDIDKSNEYVGRNAATFGDWPLLLTRPEWSAERLENALQSGRFLGTKVYLNFAPSHIPGDMIRIFDFVPRHQLEVLDARGAILILHIPRPGRLRDPQNLVDLIEIERNYPNLQVIVAHVGRAYCNEDLGDAFETLQDSPGLKFDFCANTNGYVFERALEAVGPGRLLFGSDLPITRMRMRRVCEDGRYVNIVPRGIYGDISGDPNMRDSSAEEAPNLTFFLYEEIAAFRRAAEARHLDSGDVENVFFNNAQDVINKAGEIFGKSKESGENK